MVVLAFATSSIGLLVGLVCARKARFAATERRWLSWLLLAASAAGGVGGCGWRCCSPSPGSGVTGSVVRHDLLTIAFSLAVAW